MASAKHSIAILVLFGIIAQINCVAVYCGLFSMNRKAIAAAVCEKKTRDCCGRCFLKKQIASTQENQPASNEKAPPNKSAEDQLHQFQAVEPADHRPEVLPVMGTRFPFAFASHPIAGHLPQVYQPPDETVHIAG